MMRSYSSNIGSQCTDSVIINDVASNDSSFDVKTFDKYKLALERLYVLEELEAWNPNLRSKISNDIDKEKTGAPAFLMIITKGATAIKRDDGVYEVPLACLKN